MSTFRAHSPLPFILATILVVAFTSSFVFSSPVESGVTKTITVKTSETQHIAMLDQLGDRTAQVQCNKSHLVVILPSLRLADRQQKFGATSFDLRLWPKLHKPAYRGKAP